MRDTVGHEIEIALDVHTRLNPTWAIQLCKRLEPLRPFFIEDPIRSENPQSFANLRHHTSVPIATGEQLLTKWQFRELIENEWIDYARADLGLVGGITEGKKIAAMCETHYIDTALHNPLGPCEHRRQRATGHVHSQLRHPGTLHGAAGHDGHLSHPMPRGGGTPHPGPTYPASASNSTPRPRSKVRISTGNTPACAGKTAR